MPRPGSDSSDALPLAYSQKFVHEMMQTLGPRATLLQLDTCVRITGSIDVECFDRAAAALVARHPILCSRLAVDGDRLVQREGGRTPSFEVVAVEGGPDQVDVVLSARADEPLDLFRENPFRVVLARTRPDEAFLMMLAHHMVLDATGMKILLDEYLELVLNDSAGITAAPRNHSTPGFFAFVRQEQRMVEDGTFARRARYWLGYLDEADPTLRLADRGPDPALASFSSVPLRLDGEGFQAFADRARRLGVSHFALAAAAIFQSLRTVTAQHDLLLQVVTDTRRRPFNQTIGQFADRFVLRQRERPSELNDAAARAVHRDVILAMRNQISLPHFARQVDWLDKRESREFSMAEVYVNYLSTVADPTRFSGLAEHEISPFYLTARAQPSGIPYYGVLLHWEIVPGKHALSGCLRYESALVTSPVADAVMAAWRNALRQ